MGGSRARGSARTWISQVRRTLCIQIFTVQRSSKNHQKWWPSTSKLEDDDARRKCWPWGWAYAILAFRPQFFKIQNSFPAEFSWNFVPKFSVLSMISRSKCAFKNCGYGAWFSEHSWWALQCLGTVWISGSHATAWVQQPTNQPNHLRQERYSSLLLL